MNRDPIPFIEELGYTPREATFLYAVGMHSGYFLRRQFDGYIGRVKGAISQHFLNKAERRGHIRALDYGQNRKVFHLYWKPIYRLLGDEDSQHRRVKGDLQVKIRLDDLGLCFAGHAGTFPGDGAIEGRVFYSIVRLLRRPATGRWFHKAVFPGPLSGFDVAARTRQGSDDPLYLH